ncbi:MAG: T9SS type A sorting domain-containing protein [Saprospiraceae bacterium]|nr:T9SS type A sorting domain-containing protein [Saprospiraceae bacterium]
MNQQFYKTTIVLPFLVLVLSARAGWGQALIEAQKLEDLSRNELTALTGFPALNGVVVYKVNYLTNGSDMLPDTASGLVVLPDDTTVVRLVAYQHGTTNGPTDVPSNNNTEALLVKAYAGQGYLATAADYLGLGDSRGFHPYVHAATEASAGVDLLLAARELAALEGFGSMEQIFVTGYSQGGHAAMAMAQAIHERETDDLWITAAAPMSGPYSISSVMKSVTLEDTVEYFYPSYAAYLVLGYQEVYGNLYDSIAQVFRPAFVPMIVSFHNGEIGLNTLNDFMIQQLVSENGKSIPGRLFNESYLNAILSDSLHPAAVALRDNDTYLWVPQFPMRLYYCMADDQVNFNNSLVARDYMVSQGAGNVEAIDVFPAGDHGGCVLPAVLSTLAFFNGFSMSTSIAETGGIGLVELYPNPAVDHLRLVLPSQMTSARLRIYNQMGQLLHSINNYAGEEIGITNLPNGIYHIFLQVGGNQFQNKLLIHR